MSEPGRCARCGGPLPQSGPLGGACPRCMMELGAESASEGVEDAGRTSRPTAIGRYRILRLIGEGGMGAVYEAEQDHPRRIIALKIIKPGIASPELLRRFEQESHALGRLQHPGIAQIYEAGTADTGFGPQPYFAMELIRGKTLKDYAEAHHLSVRRRLEIVKRIAEAVQHAHQRGLIHRDLKPANIMVDEEGQPKILDFGVARTSDSDAQATRNTHIGQLVGTLAYMSPEQVLADPLELDTRSDVYSLGVIFYELLGRRLPYTVSRKLHETIHAIREEEPGRLGLIDRAYRGDIETIAAKALEKDRNRRYGSAADLAADIQRYLDDEPIVARPPSATYQLQKFARRHKALVTAATAVLGVLVAGVAISSWQAVRAGRAETAALSEKDRAVRAEQKAALERDRANASERSATTERDRALASEEQSRKERDRALREKQRADTEAATATAVIEFLGNDLWAMVDPRTQARLSGTSPDPNLTVRKALDQAVPRISGKFEKQPLVEARLRETIASAYQSLDVLEPAETQLELVLQLRRRHQGENHPDALASALRLGNLYVLKGQIQNGQALLEQTAAISRRVLGDENSITQDVMSRLAAFYKIQAILKGEAFFEAVIRDQRSTLGDDHPLLWSSIGHLIDLYRLRRPAQPQPKYAQAEALLKQVLGGRRGNASVRGLNLLAEIYIAQGRYKEAEDLLVPLLSDAASLSLLADAYRKQGKIDEAESLLKKNATSASSIGALAGRNEKPGKADDTFATMAGMDALGDLYVRQGEFARALEVFEDLWVIQARDLGADYVDTRQTLSKLARLYVSAGDFARGEELLNQLLKLSLGVSGGAEQANSREVRERLAQLFVIQGNYRNAEEQFEAMRTIQRSIPGGAESPVFRVIVAQLAWTRLRQQKYEAAEKDLRTVVPLSNTSNAFIRFNWASILGASLAGQQRFAEAEPYLLEGYEGIKRAPEPGPDSFGLARFTLEDAGQWIVRLYEAWGKPEKAEEWRTKLQTENKQ
jgi:tetratricopeptide (TPR) repeat protein